VRNPEYRALAAKAYEEAVKRFPNSAYQHAQLAFVYAEQGRSEDAAREADTAIKLDTLCPHQELKLEKRRLYDPQWSEIKSTGKYEAATGPNAADFVNKYRSETQDRSDQRSNLPGSAESPAKETEP
jgi:tetratricopeptide (TPR) repeat protein